MKRTTAPPRTDMKSGSKQSTSSSSSLSSRRYIGRDWVDTILIVLGIVILTMAVFLVVYFVSDSVFDTSSHEHTTNAASTALSSSDSMNRAEANLYTLNLYSSAENEFQGILQSDNTNVLFENDGIAIITAETHVDVSGVEGGGQKKRTTINNAHQDSAFIVIHKASSASLFENIRPPPIGASTFTNTIWNELQQQRNQSSRRKRVIQTLDDCYLVNLFNARMSAALPWTVDPVNPFSFNPDWLYYQSKKTMDAWQSLTSTRLWGNLIQGASMSHINASKPANYNGVRFAQVTDSQGRSNNILAITISWYRVISGGYEIFHWNQLYNTGIPNGWGDSTVDSNKFDLPSTLTHELGHSIGLRDIYDENVCEDVTMFYAGNPNDIRKRTLATGDANGIRQLYPAASQSSVAPTFYPSQSTPPSIYSSNAPTYYPPTDGQGNNNGPVFTNDSRRSHEFSIFSCLILSLCAILSII